MKYGAGLKKYVQAGDQSCSPEKLQALAKSKVDRIRLRVAENDHAPKEALELLARDCNPDIRIAVGINPNTPPHIRFSLAADEDVNVRFGLAEEITCPVELLEKLCQDNNPYVSCRANQTRQLRFAEPRASNFECKRLFRWVSDCDFPGFKYA
ncbi:MAG: hypothetical protein JST89_13810 [Cyanobacteria bacterium SZAS-4]|nr:hypothetical protein [Cyanobacteria bacterium SZAS-4]